jgi:electron transport complex protein RnfD
MRDNEQLLVTSSPHIHALDSTAKIMWTVVVCLLPAGIWGVYAFGMSALLVIIVSIGASLLTELVLGRIDNRFTINDGSAFLTGLLIGYNMPPGVPLYIPAIASVFAIVVIKWTFGGLGGNWMNPALAGRVFVFFSWTGAMTSWKLPSALRGLSGADAITGASPLGIIKSGLFEYSGTARGPAEFLSMQNYPHTIADGNVISWLNTNVGLNLENGYFDLFVGNVPGCIGEVSALFLLLGTVYLFVKKIITWHIPVSYLLSFGIMTWMFGGLRFGGGYFSGDVLFHLLSGGLILGVFYMATDMVTSPLTSKGMIIFGVGAGLLTFLIRFFGSFPEGVSLAIIFMNIFVPLINRYTGPRRFGLAKKGQEQ